MEQLFANINNVFAFVIPISDFFWDFPTNLPWYKAIPILGNFSLAVLCLFSAGIYFTLRTGIIQLTHFRTGIQVLAQRKSHDAGISPLAAFLLSSAMRVGPGNILGVTGAISVGGVALAGLDEDGLARFRGRSVGIVFQSFHLMETMTALENVAVPLELAGRRDAFERARAELEAVGLGDRLSHHPGELSGGEQQRVAIARALAPEPAILIADEPTGNLDADTGRDIIRQMFAARARKGATLVLVTHDRALADACDRRITMRSGEIVEDVRNGVVRS